MIFQDPNLLTKYSVQQISFPKEKNSPRFLHTHQNKLWKGTLSSLRASSPFGDIVKGIPSRGTREETRKRGVGGRLFPRPLAQIGEVAHRLYTLLQIYSCGLLCDGWFCITDKIILIYINSVSSVTN